MAVVNEKIRSKFENIEKVTGEPVWKNLVHIYIKNTDQMMQDLDELVVEANTHAITGLVKMLKSSSENVGAEDLSQVCDKVEEQIHDDISFNDLQNIASQIHSQYEITKTELQKYIY